MAAFFLSSLVLLEVEVEAFLSLQRVVVEDLRAENALSSAGRDYGVS